MPSLARTRRPRTRVAARSRLCLESLEPRQPLAGNVTAELVGSTLLLTGDPLDNQFVVASATGGRIAVLGRGTTINGQASFTTTKPVTGIIANLNAGNDVVGFGNNVAVFVDQLSVILDTPIPPFDPVPVQAALDLLTGGVATFAVPGGIVVRMGDGNDLVGIDGTVGGSVVANLGAALPGATGGNGLAIGSPAAATVTSRVGGAVSVVGGPQSDAAFMYATEVRGGVAAALGDGRNNLGVNASNMASLAYTGGTGQDAVICGDATVRYGASIVTGASADLVQLVGFGVNSATIGGSLVVNTGTESDGVVIDNQVVRGAVSVVTGTGIDNATIGRLTVGAGMALNLGADRGFANLLQVSVGGSLTVVGGADVDQVQLLGCTVGLDTVINVGAGDDGVLLNTHQTRFGLYVYMGAGNDTLLLVGTRAAWAYLYGGPGVNGLQIDAASRAGIRRLYFYQFQSVT